MRHKRGRPPIGKKAMTPAQRQARRRAKLAEAAKRQRWQQDGRRPNGLGYLPLGYNPATQQMQHEGHDFERARSEFGFEEGVFVDGASVGTLEVIELAKLPVKERRTRITERRRATKDFACSAVGGYMNTLQVSREELVRYFEEREQLWERQQQRQRISGTSAATPGTVGVGSADR